MSRKIPVALLIFMAAVAANYAPLLNAHADQDDCIFGPVSNQQYRAYLLEAENRQRTRWPAFKSDNQDIDRQLNFRLSDMIGDQNSVYERIAIMHAILRAVGAEFLNTNGRRDVDPYKAAQLHHQSVVFNYQIDINRLVWFQPYPRQVWVQAIVTDPQATHPQILEKYGYQRFVAYILYFIDRPPDQSLAPMGQSCPSVPSADEASRYEVSQK